MAQCFNQWIALREIHDRVENRRCLGRVRCAIRISSERLGAEYHLVEQGWKPDRNWEAYKIIELRQLFSHCILTQSVEGKPWRIFTNDTYLAETSKLLGAIQMGMTITEPMVGVSKILGARSKQKNIEINAKRAIAKETKMNKTHYEHKSDIKTTYICCDKLMCMSFYKCSFTKRENIHIIQFMRNKFLEFSHATKRVFIGNRIKSKQPEIGINTTEYYLENLETMKYYITQGMLPLQPSCAPN